jgi:hypothetical protein
MNYNIIVRKVTYYRMDSWGLILQRARISIITTKSGAHPASCTISTGLFFKEGLNKLKTTHLCMVPVLMPGALHL